MSIRPPIVKSYAEKDDNYLMSLFSFGNKFIYYLMLLICVPLFFEMETVFKLWLGEYDLNMIEENVIVSHMYPMGKNRPNCKESWLVSLVDKYVAIYECARYKAKEALAFTFVLVINLLHF